MKRSLPADFNPVYPYDAKKPNITPPFFDPNGLGENDGNLSINVQEPIEINQNGQISLKIGNNLNIDISGQLEANLNLTSTPPIVYNPNTKTLSLNFGAGLQVISNSLLRVRILSGNPLQFDNAGNIYVRLGAGMAIDNQAKLTLEMGDGMHFVGAKNSITPNLGSSLFFNNHKIESLNGMTLWTGNNPSLNAGITVTDGCTLQLSLTYLNGIVLGNVSIRGYVGDDLTISDTGVAKTLSLIFDDSGRLNKTTSNLKGDFGFKEGNEINPTSTLNPLYLMPSKNIYPPASGPDNLIITDVMYNKTVKGKLEISFNMLSEGFSIIFAWSTDSENDVLFSTSTSTFTYVPHK